MKTERKKRGKKSPLFLFFWQFCATGGASARFLLSFSPKKKPVEWAKRAKKFPSLPFPPSRRFSSGYLPPPSPSTTYDVGRERRGEGGVTCFPTHTHTVYIQGRRRKGRSFLLYFFFLKGETAACHVHIFFRELRRPKV